MKITLYRIAQETSNNIAGNAKASQAWVTLQRRSDEVILTIRDHCRGFAPESISEERLGARIMCERAEEIGARLFIDRTPAQGTHVVVTWPQKE